MLAKHQCLRFINKNDRGIRLPALAGRNRYLAARHVAGVLEVFAHSTGYANRYRPEGAEVEPLVLVVQFVSSQGPQAKENE